MRHRRWNALGRLVMAAALLLTALPIVRAWWPSAPSGVRAWSMTADQAPVPGEIVVDARDGLSATDLQDLNRRYGVSLQFPSPHATEEKLLVAKVPVGQEGAILAQLRKDRRVEAAEPQYRYHGNWTPNDP